MRAWPIPAGYDRDAPHPRTRAVRRRRRERRRPDDRRRHRAGARDGHARGARRRRVTATTPTAVVDALPRRRRPRAGRRPPLRGAAPARAAATRSARAPPSRVAALTPWTRRNFARWMFEDYPRAARAHAPPVAPQECSSRRGLLPTLVGWPSLTTGSRHRTGPPTSRSTPPTRGSARSPRTATSCCATSPTRSPSRSTVGLEYMDWKSGGDTNFAPVATADGELDCRGFWKPGDERPDKGGRFTTNAEQCPRIVAEVESVGADFGRVRVIKLEPQGYDDALRQIHRDDNNRFNPDADGWVVRSWLELTDNPDSFMILMEQGARRPARSRHRGARPAAPRLALRRRHAAALARRVPHRHASRATRSSPASRAVPRSKPGSSRSSPRRRRRVRTPR